MKKTLSVIICLLLLFVLAMPVFAAQSAKMTVTASKTDLKPGDKVTLTVSVSKVENCTVGGFMYQFDESVFTYDSGKSLAGLKGFFAGVSTAAGNVAGFFMNGVGTVEGELFSVTLKVRDDAKAGTYTVTGRPRLTAGSDIDCTAVGAQVTVTTGTGSAAEQKPTTTPDQKPTTLPDATAPALPAPSVPDSLDTPIGNARPDADQAPLSGEISVDTIGPMQENQQFEEKPEKPAFPWWIVAVIVVVAAGGAVFLILEIKKTKKGQ